MSDTINCRWLNNMAFEIEQNGHKLLIDAAPENGGEDRGPRPKPMLLSALAGCTGMDVIYILKRKKQIVHFFNVEVSGELTNSHPKYYKRIIIKYQFQKNDDLDPKKVEAAVRLSQENFCGVSALLEKATELEYKIEYIDE